MFISDYMLLELGKECLSPDIYLGSSNNKQTAMTASDCATLCRRRAGCKFFIFFQRSLIEEFFNCYWENTWNSSCPEGWKESKFDFYELKGALNYAV